MQCLVRVFTICLCLSTADYHHLHIIHTKYPALGNFDCNTGKNCTVAEQGPVVQTVPVICLQKLFGEDLLSLTVLSAVIFFPEKLLGDNTSILAYHILEILCLII